MNSAPPYSAHPLFNQHHRGFALLTTLIILLLAGLLLTGIVKTTRNVESLAGSAIQYSRAMEAAEGGVQYAQTQLTESIGTEAFADRAASEGVFERHSVDSHWWRTTGSQGQHQMETDILLGVVEPPQYVYEEVGVYLSDGGTGVVNMELGGTYNRISAGAREYVLYRIESHGVGSYNDIERVVDTLVILSR